MGKEEKLYPNYDMDIWFRTCEQEVIKPLEGKVTGTIPSWVQGTLLRNGPGCKKIGDCQYQHVFDGMALIHRFVVKGGRATYQCKFLETEVYKKNTAANRIVVTEFGTKAVPDPCRTIFDRISSMFNFSVEATDNTVVSVYPFGDQIYAMTEAPVLYQVDPESLETLGQKRLPADSLIVFHTAHPHVMPNGDLYNVGLSTAKGYVVVKFTNNGKGNMFEKAEIVGSVKPRWKLNPAYMHSFGITENYFIIIEQPLCISLVNMMRRVIFPDAFSTALVSYPEYETKIILIHRDTSETTQYTVDNLYFMHIINSFEQDGKVMLDLCSYKDGKLIDAMYLDAVQTRESNPDYGKWIQSRPKRITIPLDAPPMTKVKATLIGDVGIEVPRINYEFNGRPYKYCYGIGSDIDTEYKGGILVKVNAETRNSTVWHEPHTYPSEPIFIPHPDAKEEDDGVVLSAVLWGKDDHKVTLLVLNAKNFEEIARVDFVTPSQAPRCFHGWYFPDQTSAK
ncbi:carotenoid isomerooxygenase-like [Maniola jurtina]|uniref:carotenoid isomerooxygenase-like n=1 Tax=Maniola jurtina TaxID=191418 RepID=UPI001E68F4C5|nr:carotenoid isomerooxygenase-like [Maniola jurtina]XP_045768130.1 carotenoid isomerooxygenase-like [Maniola jurtina]